jgi:CTP synthase
MAKYIFVTGGVVSSLGKGITAASLGRLLKSRGFKVTIQKLDPYINFDPGTMSPYQHGEVFVTEDGGETDLDLGHYERFVDINLGKISSVTAGKIYWSVISKERRGDFLGSTVQVIPHITNEIKERIYRVGKEDNADVVITEIGGTVGDIEGLPFLEAIRQVKKEVGRKDVIYLHVTLIPYINAAGELKTKPTQHSVKELRSIGIHPDIIVCRTEQDISQDMKEKLALFCDIDCEAVVQNKTASSIYEVPLMLAEEGLDRIVLDKLGLSDSYADMDSWRHMVYKILNPEKTVHIAIVGKYVELHDAYMSVSEALQHAAITHNASVNIKWVQADGLEKGDVNLANCFHDIDGILVPGGFGDRGIEGKIKAVKYARENKIPYFGICLGMQTAAIEFARNVCGLERANCIEFDPETPHPIIEFLPEQAAVENKGGTMRLGVYPCKIAENTRTYKSYQEEIVYERHRHRHEFNNAYREIITEKGMVIGGTLPNDRLVEIIELKENDHPFFVATQFHPEFKSRPTKAHPLFKSFVGAAIEFRQR